MSVKTISPAILDPFGICSFTTISKNKTDFIDDLSCLSDKMEYFYNVCHKILYNDTDNINLIEFNNQLFFLMNKQPEAVNNLIFNIINSETIKFAEQFASELNKDNFSIMNFITKHKEFLILTTKLSKVFWYYEENIHRDKQNSKKYPQITLMRSYLFYHNVVNVKYDYKGEKLYLYDILDRLIINRQINLELIIPLFKMKQFYDRFSFIPKYNREKLFNLQLNNSFLVNLGSNQDFVKSIVSLINEKIIKLSKEYNESEVQTLSDIVKFISTVKERIMFYAYYQKMLENRLLSDNVNINLEKKLLSNFKTPDDNKVIQEMMYQIDDIIASEKDKQIYVTLKVSVKQDKYKDIPDFSIEKLRREIINMKILRYYAWNDSKISYTNDSSDNITNNHSFDVPFELQPYIDIFNAYYKQAYGGRSMKWNFNVGTAVIKIKINNREYQLKVTTPQLFVLMQFNENTKITAIKLAENLGTSLSKLSPILNSLLKSKILVRDPGPANNPNMNIYIDDNFYSTNTKLSLVSLVVKNTPTKVEEKQIEEKFTIGRENIMLAKIVRVMKFKKEVIKEDLFKLVSDDLPFTATEEMFKSAVNSAIKQEYIRDDTNKYIYIDVVPVTNTICDNSDDDDEY